MDFVRNLEGKIWWIDGFHRDGKTLKRERFGEEMGEVSKPPILFVQ